LTAADPANDVIPIVDVSDTTMAASGTTKKISVNNILGASGTATLASATITGAATVGTTLGVTGQLSTANVVKATGNPGLSAAGATEGFLAHNTGYGAIIYGQGTTSDVALLDRNTGLRLSVTTSGAQVSGDLSITSGNVVMATSGKGIDFSATAGTGTSELLADYEEGAWTPVLGGFGGTSGQTYSLQTGRYTKVGRQVICSFEATLTAVGTVTGNAIISGLPFSSVSTSSQLDGGTTTIGFANNLATNQIFLSGYLNGAGAYSFITAIAAAGTVIDNITATNLFGNTTRLSGTITYTAS
jgi:hypothetical protein